MAKIMFVGKEQKRLETVLEAAQGMDIQLIPHQIEEENQEDAEEALRIAEQMEVDVVVTQGRLLQLMKDMRSTVPVLPYYYIGEETATILNSLLHDLKINDRYDPAKIYRIALLTHQRLILDKELLEDIFPVRLENLVIDGRYEENIEKFFAEHSVKEYDVVVGAEMFRRYVEEQGVFFYYKPGIQSVSLIRKVLNIAQMMAEAMSALQQKRRELQTTVDYAFEAIVMLDETGRVVLLNNKACQTFQLDYKDAIGRKICDVIPQIQRQDISHILHQGGNIFGDILRRGNQAFVVNLTAMGTKEHITGAMAHFTELERVEQLEATVKNQYYVKGHKARYDFGFLVGQSQKLKDTTEMAKRFANYDANVLLLGETGTGKEVMAQSIHNASLRSKEAFVALNCGAIPQSLLESELFGYVDGAFTGASRRGKKGKLEIADKGTLFLDEISEMSWQGQAQLLRVLEERTISRIGDDKVTAVDVRVIAASNKNLRKMVEEGKFREDLYYRLNVLTLSIPPLREREGDVRLLARSMVNTFSERYHKAVKLLPEAEDILEMYRWPGNVRQLRNFMERLVIVANTADIDREFLIRQMEDVYTITWDEYVKQNYGTEVKAGNVTEPAAAPKAETADEQERIVDALNRCDGSRQKAAELLHMSKATLWRKMKKYGIGERF